MATVNDILNFGLDTNPTAATAGQGASATPAPAVAQSAPQAVASANAPAPRATTIQDILNFGLDSVGRMLSPSAATKTPAPAAPARAPTSATSSNMSQSRLEAIVQGMSGAESNGQQFDANGNPLTSPKGAVGVAQVLPSTGPEAARLAGLPWDPNKFRQDRSYNLALGAAYLKKQIADFGDEAKGIAAYNTGPGNMRAALARAAQSGKSWFSHVPTETQQYVPRVLDRANRFMSQQASPKISDASEFEDEWGKDQVAQNDDDQNQTA